MLLHVLKQNLIKNEYWKKKYIFVFVSTKKLIHDPRSNMTFDAVGRLINPEIKQIQYFQYIKISILLRNSISRTISQTMSQTRRILVYIIPVTAISFALNIPKVKKQRKKIVKNKTLLVHGGEGQPGRERNLRHGPHRDKGQPHLCVLVHSYILLLGADGKCRLSQ